MWKSSSESLNLTKSFGVVFFGFFQCFLSGHYPVVTIPWVITRHKSVPWPLGCCVKPRGNLGNQCSTSSFSSHFSQKNLCFL